LDILNDADMEGTYIEYSSMSVHGVDLGAWEARWEVFSPASVISGWVELS